MTTVFFARVPLRRGQLVTTAHVDAVHVVADTTGETVSTRVVRVCASCGSTSALLDHDDLCPPCQPHDPATCQCVSCRGDIPALEEGQ